MSEPLQQLLTDGVIEAVIARLKSGKEADIWLVQHAGEVVAAKVYKDLHARSFHNNAAYKEGRQVRDSRTQRAMTRGSRFGQRATEDAWKAKESEALHALYAAGVRVPRPLMLYEGVLLMEAVVDEAGHAAPRLIDAAIPPERAAEWYADLRQQVVRMLSCDLIHGDLSPYNVLLAWNGPTVIDFPQVVGAAHNSQAEHFFQRDLETIRRFFAPLDPAVAAAAGDAREIWRAYVRRELTPDFVPTGRMPPEPARGDERRGGQQEHRGGQRGNRGGQQEPPGEQRGNRGGQQEPPGEQRGNRGGQKEPPGEQRGNRGGQKGPRRERHGSRGGQPPADRAAPPSPARGEGRGGAFTPSAPESHPPHRESPAASPPRRGESPAPHSGSPRRGSTQPAQRGAQPPADRAAPPSPPRGDGRAPKSAPAPHPPHRESPAAPPPHRGESPAPHSGGPRRDSSQPTQRGTRPSADRATPPPPPRGEGRGGAPTPNPPPRRPRREPPGPVVTYMNRPLASTRATAPPPTRVPPERPTDGAPYGHRRRKRRH